MMLRRVGILGGMGPEATVLLMSKIIAAVSADDDCDHIPLIVDQNSQVPSRIERLLNGGGDDPEPILTEMAKRLESSGADALAMSCNTAHHYAAAISSSVKVPFINMVSLSAARARQMAGVGGRVGVLASPAVRRIGLFDGAFDAVGLTTIYPANDDAVLGAIRSIKAEGINGHAREIFRGASEALLADGVAIQVIGCTEFSLIAGDVATGASAFDTLDVLTEAIVAFSHGVSSETLAAHAGS